MSQLSTQGIGGFRLPTYFDIPMLPVCEEFVGVRSYERNRNKTRRDLNMLVDFRVVEKRW
ncbi:MAG: hypothetical protein ACRD8Z_02115 [Nitrososphaeraceae archaeon]